MLEDEGSDGTSHCGSPAPPQQHRSSISARIAYKMGHRVLRGYGFWFQGRTMSVNHSFSERISTNPSTNLLLRYGIPAAAIAAVLAVCHVLTGLVDLTTL